MSTDVLAETEFPPDLRERTGKVYITAPRTVDLKPLREALRQNGLQPISLEDVPVSGSLAGVVREASLESDFVVAVLDKDVNRNVMYEVGVAHGLNRPVLFFALPDARDLIPWDISHYRVFYGPIDSAEVLRKHIAAIKAGVLQSRPQPPVLPKLQPLGDRTDECRKQFFTAAEGNDSLSLSNSMRQLFTEVGFDALTTRDPVTDRVEAAVWTNEWTPWIPNPLVLDVWSPGGGSPPLDSLTRFSNSLADRSIGWGVVLAPSFNSDATRELRRVAPYVLLLTYDELFDRLKTTSFPKIVVSLRNHRVHGEG